MKRKELSPSMKLIEKKPSPNKRTKAIDEKIKRKELSPSKELIKKNPSPNKRIKEVDEIMKRKELSHSKELIKKNPSPNKRIEVDEKMKRKASSPSKELIKKNPSPIKRTKAVDENMKRKELSTCKKLIKKTPSPSKRTKAVDEKMKGEELSPSKKLIKKNPSPNKRTKAIVENMKRKALSPNKKLIKKKPSPSKRIKAVVETKRGAAKKGYSVIDENSVAMKRALEIKARLPPEFPTLVKFMLGSHVTGGFWLGLSKLFCVSHLPNHDANICLVDEDEKESQTKYLVEKNGLSAGWRGFSIDHKLVPGDVCIFQLTQPCRFKVIIVRKNATPEIDGAMTLLNLSNLAQPIATDDGMGIPGAVGLIGTGNSSDETQPREAPISVECPGSNQQGNGSGSGSDRDNTPQFPNSVRFAESEVEFADVKDFESFNVVANGLIIDSEIPENIRADYYELCCSCNMYLHQNIIEGMNFKLIAGMISETTNIADAIKGADLTTSRADLEAWDKTLKGCECIGMEVGFLRERLGKLISLSGGSEEVMRAKRAKLNKAEAEAKDLTAKLALVNEDIENLGSEIEVFSRKGGIEMMFKNVATAPW